MIPYKQLDLRVLCLQTRRVACEHCDKPFTFLAQARERVIVTAIPVVTSDDAMHKAMLKKVLRRLRKLDQDREWGQGLCPHCSRYQGWMIRRSRRFPAIVGGVFGLVGGMFLFLCFAATRVEGPGLAAFLAFSVLGCGIGTWIGVMRALRPGVRRGMQDPFAIPDDDARSLLDHCLSIKGDLPVEWYLSVHADAPDRTGLVGMGCRDYCDEDFFPEALSSETVLDAIES